MFREHVIVNVSQNQSIRHYSFIDLILPCFSHK
jgi:hypothetical protein